MLHYQEPFGFLQQGPPFRDTDNSKKCLDLGFANYPGDTLQMRGPLLRRQFPGFQVSKVVYDWVFTLVSKVHSALGFNFRSLGGYQRNSPFCVLSLGQFPEKPNPLWCPSNISLQLGYSNRCSVISPHLPVWIQTQANQVTVTVTLLSSRYRVSQ